MQIDPRRYAEIIDNGEALARKCGRLEQENAELRKQVEELKGKQKMNKEYLLKMLIDQYAKYTTEYSSTPVDGNWVNYLTKVAESMSVQLANAIVPKFKIGQEVWIVWIKETVYKGHIDSIIESAIEIQYMVSIINAPLVLRTSAPYVFATQAEAEEALAKIKGEK